MKKPGQYWSAGLEAAAVEAQKSVDDHGQPVGGRHKARTLTKQRSEPCETAAVTPLSCNHTEGPPRPGLANLLDHMTDKHNTTTDPLRLYDESNSSM